MSTRDQWGEERDPLTGLRVATWQWRYEDDKTAQRADSMFGHAVDEHGEVLGYWGDEVARHFGAPFRDWMYGQTMASINGRGVVYRHDVWRYMDGLGPLD